MSPTPTSTTETDRLAEQHDAMKAAVRDRAARQSAEQRRARAHRSAERRLARAETDLEGVEAELSAKLPVAEEIEQRLSETTERIESTSVPPTSDLFLAVELTEAHGQARSGAQRVTGLSVHETGHATPRTVLVPHPLLAQVAAELELGEIDWNHGVEPLESRRQELVAERDSARRELEALEN